MGAIKGFTVKLRALLHRSAAERDLDDEIRFHIELETEKNIAAGMRPSEARRRALVAFGGVERHKEEHRDVRGVRWLGEIRADIRYTLRGLRRGPALAAAAIITLALGVGANTAIFSAVNAVILRPLPFPSPDRLVMLWEENAEKGWYENVAAPANYLDWREQVAAFKDVAAYNGFPGRATLTGHGHPHLLTVTRVTGNFFSVLGVHAQLGRTLRDAETWDTGSPVAVISDRLWRQNLGGDPGVVGRTIQLDGRAVQVVGVMPPSFAFPQSEIDAWLSTAWDPAARTQPSFRRAHWLRVVARLRPGISLDRANAELQTVVHRLQRDYPETNKVMGAGMTPLHRFLVGDTRLPLLVLMGAVALLLLIACANVGNLLLVRAAGREREAALRLALGAGRGRLVRQAITESLVLSALGGAAGLVLGWWGTHMLVALQLPAGMLPVRDVRVSWSVLGYVLAITTASGLLFGIAPAFWSGRRVPVEVLKEGGRSGSEGRRVRRWGDGLVVGEVALALMLTLGAGLLVRSYWQLQHVDPGFDPNGVLAVSLELPSTRFDTDDKTVAFYQELLQRLRALPGVSEAAAVLQPPLTGTAWTSDFAVAGWPAGEYGTEVAHQVVTPGYFHAMRVALRNGRVFSDADRKGTAPVVIINDVLARKYFRGQNPVGQRITFDKVPDSASTWYTIVGVVESEHQTALAIGPQIEVFAPFAQDGNNQTAMTLMLRTDADPASLAPSARRVIGAMDPDLVVTPLPMTAVLSKSLARPRFLTTLLLVFAAVGLTLAVVGVYGVMAQLARRRLREMGIRIALGARGAQVQWLVVRHGLRLVGAGVVIGTVVSLGATRALAALLYQVAPTDPATYVGVVGVLVATAVVATWVPAAAVSRADPAGVLRGE